MLPWHDHISIQIHPQPLPDCSTTQSTAREGHGMAVESGTSPSFSTLKRLATTAPVLAYFNPSQPVKLSVDASSKGLGAVLNQNDHPVAYAS